MLITDHETLKNYAASKSLWLGIPSIEVTNKGRTFLTYYSGGTREEIGNFCALIVSDDGEHFGDPIAVSFEENHRCFDPCLWIDPLGRLWYTWTRYPDEGLFGAICEDPDAETIVFGEEFFIGHNIMMNKPVVLSTGEWAFPLAVWNHGVRVANFDSLTEPKGSFMYVTNDCGKTFRQLGGADVQKRSFDEHMFLELTSGIIRVFVRTTYGIGAADSYDGGLHWGKDFDTGYGGPCSRFHIRRLPSGRVLLINHHEFSGRNNLTAMLSEDDGKTFPYRLLLDGRKDVSYPDATLTADGRIHITYDRERGAFCSSLQKIMSSAREILTACITEEDILAGKLVTADSYLQRVAYKLTDYDGELQNPFHEKELFTDGKYADYLHVTGTTVDAVVAQIFDAYPVNCSNLHRLEAETLDRLIETYQSNQALSTLNEIITLVRSAHSDTVWSEKSITDMLCRSIMEHPEQPCSAESLAEKFHFSAHYIRHVFKKQTGISVSGFRTAQRIKKAKLLLRMREDRITDIAAACGFENPSYFTEVFLRETGLSPTEFRQNHAQKV